MIFPHAVPRVAHTELSFKLWTKFANNSQMIVDSLRPMRSIEAYRIDLGRTLLFLVDPVFLRGCEALRNHEAL